MRKANLFSDLEVYQEALALQRAVFQVSKLWPKEETYSLTGQIRRSSRSVGANVAEAWAKRRYPAHFLSKLTDADGELQETLHWLSTAQDCQYLMPEVSQDLRSRASMIGAKLGSMMNQHEKFCFGIAS